MMRFGVVPSLLVPNAKMLFVLISCPLSRSESEKVQTLLDWNADLVCVCGRELQCVWGSPRTVWLCAHPCSSWLVGYTGLWPEEPHVFCSHYCCVLYCWSFSLCYLRYICRVRSSDGVLNIAPAIILRCAMQNVKQVDHSLFLECLFWECPFPCFLSLASTKITKNNLLLLFKMFWFLFPCPQKFVSLVWRTVLQYVKASPWNKCVQ